MKKSISFILFLGMISQGSFAAEEVTLIGGGQVETVEIPCHFSFSKVMTSEEAESYKDQKCFGLRIKDAEVVGEDGSIKKIESFEMPSLMKRVTASVVRESRECVDMYASKMNLLFDYQRSSGKQLDFGKRLKIQESYKPNLVSEVKIPTHYTVETLEDGRIIAQPSVKSIELQSENRVLNSLNSVVNKVVNKTAEVTDVREGFGISQKKNGEQFDACSSVAVEREVQIDDEKYAQNLDGSVVNDSRKYLGNIWKKTVHTTGNLINNVTASTVSK